MKTMSYTSAVRLLTETARATEAEGHRTLAACLTKMCECDNMADVSKGLERALNRARKRSLSPKLRESLHRVHAEIEAVALARARELLRFCEAEKEKEKTPNGNVIPLRRR
jgi:hypothetical protein